MFNDLGDEAPVPDDGIKPTFTERPVIRQSDDGGKITFECRCVGDPKPSIQWYSRGLITPNPIYSRAHFSKELQT